ncbi:MAG TPA: hypothetical protein DHW63_02500 [Hyphomonadaceae bacterium]|nr:hypothetical protein [Hyphomonadaceae bacterium]
MGRADRVVGGHPIGDLARVRQPPRYYVQTVRNCAVRLENTDGFTARARSAGPVRPQRDLIVARGAEISRFFKQSAEGEALEPLGDSAVGDLAGGASRQGAHRRRVKNIGHWSASFPALCGRWLRTRMRGA